MCWAKRVQPSVLHVAPAPDCAQMGELCSLSWELSSPFAPWRNQVRDHLLSRPWETLVTVGNGFVLSTGKISLRR